MRKKTIVMFLCIITLAVTGCQSKGKTNYGDEQYTAEDLIKKAEEVISELNSYASIFDSEVIMEDHSGQMTISWNIETKQINEPDKLYVSVEQKTLTDNISLELYGQKQGEVYNVFLSSDGTSWQSRLLRPIEYEQLVNSYGNGAFAFKYLPLLTDVKKGGLETIDAIETVKISGALKGSALAEAIVQSGISWALSTSVTEDMVTGLEISADYWIDVQNGAVVRAEFRMEEALESLLAQLAGNEAGTEDSQIDVHVPAAVISIQISDMNRVNDFEMPAGAE